MLLTRTIMDLTKPLVNGKPHEKNQTKTKTKTNLSKSSKKPVSVKYKQGTYSYASFSSIPSTNFPIH